MTPLGRSTQLRGCGRLGQVWRDGLRPDPLLTVSEWADAHRYLSPRAFGRAGTLPHRSHALHARDHGCAVAVASGAPRRGDEVGAGRLYRRGQLLDWLRHPSCAGPDAGGAADGRARQALFTAAHRAADCREPGIAGAGQAVPRARRRQHRAVEGIPGGAAHHHRRQQRGGSCARCRRATCFWTRSMPIRRLPTRRATRLRSPKRARAPSRGVRRFCSGRRRRSKGSPGSSANTRRRTSAATSCRARTASTCSGSSSSGCAGTRGSPRPHIIYVRPAMAGSRSTTRPRCSRPASGGPPRKAPIPARSGSISRHSIRRLAGSPGPISPGCGRRRRPPTRPSAASRTACWA